MALGSNALDSLATLGRMMGLVAAKEARDTAAIHAYQRALFVSARDDAAREGRHQQPGEKN